VSADNVQMLVGQLLLYCAVDNAKERTVLTSSSHTVGPPAQLYIGLTSVELIHLFVSSLVSILLIPTPGLTLCAS